jgi:hypothetical protein
MPTNVYDVASTSAMAAAVNVLGAPLAPTDPDLLKQIAVLIANARQVSGQFNIPPYNEVAFTYVAGGAADDDDISTQVFKLNNVTVATLTYTYFGSTNNVKSIIQS